MSIALNELITIFTMAAVLIGLFYLPGIKVDINLADEGYLWHGTLKVLSGKIPIRDFRAYDPGRYYWCALWMRLLGSDLLSLRIVMLITQILALTSGLTVVYIATDEWLPVILAGLLLVLWMFPMHKQLDVLFSNTTPLIAVLLVNNPADSQYLISGIYVSVCLFFGLNHGIYAGGALSLLILIMGILGQGLSTPDAMIWFALGLCIGVAPLLAFYFFIPRLFNVYWQQKVRRILRRGTANLPLPFPWLWKSEVPQIEALNKGGQLVVRTLFTIMPFMYVAALLPLFLGDEPASSREWYLAAVSCSGLLYLHHAFSRADLNHLAQSIAPFLMCQTIYLTSFSYAWLAVCLFIVIFLKYIYLAQNSWLTHLFNPDYLKKFTIDDTDLWINSHQAAYLNIILNLIRSYSRPDETVLLLPFLVTFYPILQKDPPVYDLFCVYPATEEEESTMIKELSEHDVSFALINNGPLDNREELRFSQTHAMVWQYLNHEFQMLRDENIPPDHYAFVRHK